MKRLALHTVSFSLAAIFLLSFTGVRMLMHHCLSCEVTDVALMGFGGGNPEALHNFHVASSSVCNIDDDWQDVDHTCCSHAPDEHTEACHGCCQSEVRYLKNDYQISQERSPSRVEPVAQPAINELRAVVSPLMQHLAFSPPGNLDDEAPPPNPTGRDFVIFAHQLKIC